MNKEINKKILFTTLSVATMILASSNTSLAFNEPFEVRNSLSNTETIEYKRETIKAKENNIDFDAITKHKIVDEVIREKRLKNYQ